ncbi:MAG: glycosyltransferase [Aromatoleum sp.]|nr:glycosyltransferase [Aromatoleum sp.]
MAVSVVIISKNEAGRLRLALASYDAAVAKAAAVRIDTEIIVVNDGSSDDTIEVLEQYAGALPLKVVHNTSSVGIAHARNRGAAAAAGDILLFMDGDVLIGPEAIVAHAERHRERGRRTIVRGASAYLRCTRPFLDPQTGTPFPGQEAAVARMGNKLPDSLVTIEHVRHRFDTIEARARPGIYIGSIHADLYAAEIEALEKDGRPDVCWMTVPGHNVSVPKADFAAVGGYDGQQLPIENRELGLRLCARGLDVVYAKRARSYHLAHQGQGRDPLTGRPDWITAFYGKHQSLAAKLMLIFWHGLARSTAIPEAARIDSILHLARILRDGSTYDYERLFRNLVAASAP